MSDYKVVWIASMPRSGSTWAYNIARSLLRRAGHHVAPELMPKSEEEIARTGRNAQREPSPNVVWCLKSHLIFKNPPPVNRFISTFRNPREAVVSYMRFTRCNFDDAINAAKVWKHICEAYRSMPADIALCLDYEDIIHAPLSVGNRIAAFLGLQISQEEQAQIIEEFSRDKVRERILGFDKGVEGASLSGEIRMAVPNVDGTIRFCDRRTGFQSDHISDPDDDYEVSVLNERQRHALDEVVGSFRPSTQRQNAA